MNLFRLSFALFIICTFEKERINSLSANPKMVKHTQTILRLGLRGNDASFMTKEFRKAIYTRSRLRNNFSKNSTKYNERLYKKERNKCVSLRSKCIRNFFSNITK